MYKTTHTRRNSKQSYDLQADLERIKDAFADTANDVRGKTGEIFAQSASTIRERSLQTRDTMADYIAEQPFKSLGIAVLIGIFIGYFVHK